MLSTQPAHPDRRWAALAAAITVALLVAHRYVVGAGLGLDAEAAASGILEFPEDNFAYVAYLEQVRAGVFPFINPFAGAMPQGEIYANPLFLLLGLVASWTGLPAAGVMVCAGLIATGCTVYLAHAIASSAGLGRNSARCAALLTAFGSGLSAVVAVFASSNSGWIGVDRTHQDAIGSSTFAVYPFQAITLAILAALLLAIVRRRRGTVIVLGAVSALARPYESVLCVATYAVFAAFSAFGDRRRRITVSALALAGTLPALAYGFWVSRQPAWVEYSTITIAEIEIDRRAWITGYGLFLPLALLGSLVPRSAGESGTRRWFSWWVTLLLVLLVGVGIDQVKLASGAQLPLAVLAGHGFAALIGFVRSIDAPLLHLTGQALCLAIAAGFVVTPLHLVSNVYDAHALPAGLRAIASTIRGGDNASESEPLPLVLCDRATGILLPGLVGCRVHAGHWSMTPSRGARIAELYEAGIDLDRLGLRTPTDRSPNSDALDELSTRVSATYLVLDREAPARTFADGIAGLRFVTESGAYRLYRRDAAATDKR